MALTWTDICKLILAVLLPPLGVLMERGCGVDLLINIGLTLLGYIPGTCTAHLILQSYPISGHAQQASSTPCISLSNTSRSVWPAEEMLLSQRSAMAPALNRTLSTL